MSVQDFVVGLGDPYALARRQDEAYRQIRGTKDIQVKAEEDRQNRLAAAQQREVYRSTVPGEAEMPAGLGIPGITPVVSPPAAPSKAGAGRGLVNPPLVGQPQPSYGRAGAGRGLINPPMAGQEQPYQNPAGYTPPAGLSGPEQLRQLQEARLRRFADPAATAASDRAAAAGRQAGFEPPAAPTPAAPTPAAAPRTSPAATAADSILTPEFFAVQRQVESGNRPDAVSPKGAVGTMQTMPGTLRDPGFGVAPARDNSPAEMQRVGEDYMRAMLREFGNLPDALVAYNWGPAKARQWVATGRNVAQLPAETQGYLQKILGAVGGAVNAMVPSAQAAQPTPAAPAAPTAAPQQFTPEQYMAARAQNSERVRFAQLRLQQLQQLAAATRDVASLEKINAEAFAARSAIYEGQLYDVHTRAMQGDENALSQLAQVVGVPIAKVGDGYVVVQVDPATGNGRAISQPMSAGELSTAFFNRAAQAGRESVAKRAEAEAKARGEIAVEQVRGQYALYKTQAEAERDIQKLLAERRLTQNDIKGVEFDPIRGTAYVRTNSGVMQLRPGTEVDGMMTEPTLVPVRAMPSQ